MDFIKFHGFGNDYIVLEEERLARAASFNDFARRICDRHYGAGADGIAVVSPASDGRADFSVRIFNPDGSEAGMSGNGTRCAAAYLYYQTLWSGEELRLQTRTGVKLYRLLGREGRGQFRFESELGRPKFDSTSVPMLTDVPRESVVDYPLEVGGETVQVTALQMGNPMCCVFVDDFAAVDWRRLGRALESHPQFPERANIIFVRVESRAEIELRIWERGVGETSASGTGSCAAVIASVIKGRTERRLTVNMPGGQAEIEWRVDGEVVLLGGASVIYGGTWLAPNFPLDPGTD